jgi:hypothetical protein
LSIKKSGDKNMINKKIFYLFLIGAMGLASSKAASKPQWINKQLGISGLSPNYVEPGFGLKPLHLYGKTVVMDFKRLTVGPYGLPQSILVRDEPVLKKPMRLLVSDLKQPLDFKIKSSEIKKTGKNAVAGNFVLTSKDIEVKVNFKVDYDFTFIYSITLNPLKSVNIKRFALETPLNLPDDKLMTANQEPPNRLQAGIEAQRQRLRLCIKDSKLVKPGYCPSSWLGNTRYGISFNFPTGRDWKAPTGKELIFNPQNSLLTFNFIDEKTTLDKPITYEFYMVVTPVRQMPKDWRAWKVRTRYGNFDKTDGNQMIYWSFWRAASNEVHNNHWIRTPDLVRRIARQDKAKGRSIMHYFIPSHITHTILYDKDGKNFVLEDSYLRKICEQNTYEPGYKTPSPKIPQNAQRFTDIQNMRKTMGIKNTLKGKASTATATMAPEIIDFLLWGAKKMIDLGADGIYSDGNSPKPNYKGASIGLSGHPQPYFAIEAYRTMYKRLRELVRANNPKAQMIAHNSGNLYAPTLSFFDMILFGETYFYWYQEPDKRDASRNGDFYYAHIWGDVDNLKLDYHGAWGLPQVLLPELRGRNRKMFPQLSRGTRTMLTYTIQFDMLYWPIWCDAKEIIKFDNIRHKFGMKDTVNEIVEFNPYWTNKLFKCNDPKVKVGYYEKVLQHDPDYAQVPKRRFLVLVSNLQFGDTESKLSVPAGLKNSKVIDRQHNTVIKVENGTIPIKLAPYDFAVFEVTGEME